MAFSLGFASPSRIPYEANLKTQDSSLRISPDSDPQAPSAGGLAAAGRAPGER